MYYNNDVIFIKLTMYNVKDICTYDIHDVIIFALSLWWTKPYKLYEWYRSKIVKIFIEEGICMPFLKKDLNSVNH